MTIYKSCNLSFLNLVQFSKLTLKSSKLKKCTQKKQVQNRHLDTKVHLLFASQMSLSSVQIVVAVGPSHSPSSPTSQNHNKPAIHTGMRRQWPVEPRLQPAQVMN